MKIQDIVFFIILIGLIFSRRPRLFIISGVIAILMAMPFFQLKIALFTAERLVMYAAAFFLVNVIYQMIELKRT